MVNANLACRVEQIFEQIGIDTRKFLPLSVRRFGRVGWRFAAGRFRRRASCSGSFGSGSARAGSVPALARVPALVRIPALALLEFGSASARFGSVRLASPAWLIGSARLSSRSRQSGFRLSSLPVQPVRRQWRINDDHADRVFGLDGEFAGRRVSTSRLHAATSTSSRQQPRNRHSLAECAVSSSLAASPACRR